MNVLCKVAKCVLMCVVVAEGESKKKMMRIAFLIMKKCKAGVLHP